MSEFTCMREGEVDIIFLQDNLDEPAADRLIQTITTLRQQGCVRLLLQGESVKRIQVSCWETLARPIRIFRGMGGVVAVANFSDPVLRQLRAVSWYRFLNVFRTREEALRFLSPSGRL